MQRNRPPSPQTVNVLRALAADPARWPSRSVRITETPWEPSVDSRPPRHLYRLTGAGRDFVAALTAAHSDRTATNPRRRLSEA